MKVRLLKPYMMNDAGAVLDVELPIASLLIERGVAVSMVGHERAVSRAAERETAVTHKATRKRGVA